MSNTGTKAACGTRGGYQKHLRNNEHPCDLCKQARLEYSRKYKESNPEKYKATQKSWVNANRDKVRAIGKRWRQNNPEFFRAYSSKRRALEMGASHTPYSTAEVLSTYGENCHICNEHIDLLAPKQIGKPGWEKGLHLDHLTPLINGGEDNLQNIRPAHGLCNLKKWAH